MRIQDAAKSALKSLRHSRMRTFLTMLGIVIGVASVIILISVGNSAQALIVKQVQDTGSNLVFIVPGASKGSRFASPPSVQGIVIKTLVAADVQALKRDPAITAVAPEVRGQAKVIFENNDTTVTFDGTNGDFFSIRNFKTTQGTTFTNQDVLSLNRVAVIGSEIAKTLFGERDAVGKTIRLKNVSLRVVGVLEKKGLGPFGVDQDNLILIPITIAQNQLLGIDHYNVVTAQANEAYTTDYVAARITSILRQSHHITDPDKDDFTIQTQADALSLLGNITSILTVFLGAIASISLLVGGIGIMNIMLVSVVERTKEIGLRKAVGATNRDILTQFLVEAIFVTSLGGIVGTTIGALFIALLYEILVHTLATGWAFALPFSAIALSLGVAVATGLVFGIYPARNAARKNPIDALRYE